MIINLVTVYLKNPQVVTVNWPTGVKRNWPHWSTDPTFAFRYINNDIAYLRISSFLKYHRTDFKQDFYRLYDIIFKQFAQRTTKNLILDLRNNEGDDDTGEKLITFLLTRPYKHYDYTEEMFTGYPSVVDYLENGKELFFIDSLVYKTTSGKYRLKEAYYNQLYKIQHPDRYKFKGKIYVLKVKLMML